MSNGNSDKKGIIKAMFIALIATLAGLAVLGWQYRQIENKRLPALEEKLEEQRIAMEEREARDILDAFMTSRIEGDEVQATLYLTERAVEQKETGSFEMMDNFLGFKVLNSQKISEEEFCFTVSVYKEGVGEILEIITMKKILDSYYIDSVKRAG